MGGNGIGSAVNLRVGLSKAGEAEQQAWNQEGGHEQRDEDQPVEQDVTPHGGGEGPGVRRKEAESRGEIVVVLAQMLDGVRLAFVRRSGVAAEMRNDVFHSTEAMYPGAQPAPDVTPARDGGEI